MAAPSQLVGQILGHYRILEQIGAGGMGVIYRAHDERLDRDVAVKVLPPGVLADETARKRFRREALTLSKLTHPNIATVHDFDTQDDRDFLVMEYVSGETLAEGLSHRGLPEKEVLSLGMQIAQTLQDAHEQGVIHRDLKPGNIMLTPRGQVKLLDFGLARLLRTSETAATESLTETYQAAGTLSYMAPEQLRGEAVDPRSDIYALGALLYEMATGRRPFAAKISTALVADIIHKPASSPRSINPNLSPEFAHIILKCLEKEPENRYQSARELAVDLRRLTYPSLLSPEKQPGPKRKRAVFTLVGALFALAAVFSLSRWVYLRKGTVPPLQYEQLTNFSESADWPALSPDGRMLAFTRGSDNREIYVKPLPSGEPVLIVKDAFEKSRLTFSPDGSRIAYTVEAPLGWDTWVVPLLGGQPRRLLPNASGLTWIDDRHVLFSEVKTGIHMGVMTATESRTEARDVYLPPTETGMVHESSISPDHKWVFLTEMDATGDLPCRIVPFDGSSSGYQVGPKAPCGRPAWSADGKWVYFSANPGEGYHIWRQRFPHGEPEQVTFGATEEEGLTLPPDGHSVVVAVSVEQSGIWLRDASGEREISAEGFATLPSFSSDGKKLYYLVRSAPPRAFLIGELWAVEPTSGRRERTLPGFSMTHYNVSRDGGAVVFSALDTAGKSGIWLASLDRRFAPRQLTSSNDYWPFFGRPGEILFVGEEGKSKFLYRMKEDGTERQRIMQDEVLYLVSISPDGEWAVAWVPVPGQERSSAVLAYPTRGGVPIRICDVCTAVWTGPAQGAAAVSWSPDSKFFYVSFQYFPGMNRAKTFVIPLRLGQSVPPLPKRGIMSERDLTSLPGVRVISAKDVFAGPNPSVYAFRRLAYSSNIYRVRLP